MTTPANGSLSLLSHRPFLFYLTARGAAQFAYQIATVAMGWQVYELTNSAFYLGLAGLMQFLPSLLLIFVGGHVADRYQRNRILQICQTAEGLAAVYLIWSSIAGSLNVIEIFAALVLFGTAKAFENPASAALLPAIVPASMFQRGVAVSTSLNQIANISGPALGGFIYAISPVAPYVVMVVFWLTSAVLNGLIKVDRPAVSKQPPTISDFLAGIMFVRKNPAILGSISLDLFAVLLGGATALLPIYARDILDAGPWALGVLRGSPAIGALVMSVIMTRFPISRRVGMRMFMSVIVFGLAIIVFSLSKWIWLSCLALVVMGAADMVSMIIRTTLVQLRTPDAMRGRVSAVNFLFINASNQLGEFESGMVAALVGAVPAAFIGGVGTIVVALLWMKIFPTLRDIERLE